MNRTASLLMAAFVTFSYLYAEPLRVAVTGTLTISDRDTDGQKATMGFSSAIGISVEPSPFIEAIELELRVPAAATKIPGAFLWMLYKTCTPNPSIDTVSYTAGLVASKELPSRLSFVIQVPVRKNHVLKPGPYASILPNIVELREYPLLFRLMPVMKGLSPEIENSQFSLKVRPVLIDEGIVQLSFKVPDSVNPKSPIEVTIDDKKISVPTEPIQLKTGPHYLRVSGEDVMDENRTIVIERAKSQEIEIALKDTTPILILEAPDTAQVWLDGIKLDPKERNEILSSPGEHIALFKVGDYTVSKKITVQKGRRYRIILSVDIQVQED